MVDDSSNPRATSAGGNGEGPGRQSPPGGDALSRRGLLRRAGVLSAGAVAAGLWQSGPAAAAPVDRAGFTAGGMPEAVLPSLDELAGTWMPVGTLFNLPSVNNFHGSLHAGSNLMSFTELSLPPLSMGGECARLALGGVNVQAHESRWYPYQVQRRTTMGTIALQSTVRMGFERPLVLIELQVTNTGGSQEATTLDVELGGYVRSYPGPWQWTVPRQYGDFTAWSGHLTAGGQTLVVEDGASQAAAAFAFPTPPSELESAGNSGSARWNLTLRPGEHRILQLVVAVAVEATTASSAAMHARAHFAELYTQAHTGWQQRFFAAFTPGNSHFSGSLPTLRTPDRRLRHLYYLSVVSVLESERTCFTTFFPRTYVTAGPQWGVTLTYFWDTSLFAPLLVLLDPQMVREQAKKWLELGIYNGYAVDALSGQLVGPWYSANDLSVFTALLSYLTLTGDMGFLDEQAGPKNVIDHMESIALDWQRLRVPATGLADYGGRSNLLEEVPSYVNQVPSLNAANVWMMRQLAALRQARDETSAARRLSQQADELAARVLALYVAGQGVWETVHDDGTRAAVRHIYDFDTIGRLLADELTPAMRSEMAAFATRELFDGGWMRALSLSDTDAAVSLRPDHGSNGAYDAWPALAAGAMARFGAYDRALLMLRVFAGVGAEGPLAQSHELVPEPSGVVAWDRDDLNPVSTLTVSAWINLADRPQAGTWGSIVAKDATAGAWFPTTPPNVGYTLRVGAAGAVSFAVGIGGKFPQAITSATIPTGSWHHVLATYDGHQIAVYIDGTLAATTAASGGIVSSTGTNLMIGADPIDPQAKFTGAMQDVRVYKRALSSAEASALSAAPDPAYGADDPALVLRLPMDEGHGEYTTDAITALPQTIIDGTWVPGRNGTALAFTKSAKLTVRTSRQQYNQPNGGSFFTTVLQDLLGYTPDGRRIMLRDRSAPRGIDATLHGIRWKERLYTLNSTTTGVTLT